MRGKYSSCVMHPYRKKAKCKFRPIKDLEEPGEECRYSSILSLTAVLDEGGVVNATPWTLNPENETRYPLNRTAGGPQGLPGREGKYLATTGIWSPNRPARSESLYQIRYPGQRRYREMVGKIHGISGVYINWIYLWHAYWSLTHVFISTGKDDFLQSFH